MIRCLAASYDALHLNTVHLQCYLFASLQHPSFKMADVANTTTAFCTNYVPCNDSPLSMSANIAGLITFTIAISAALRFYVSAYNHGIERIKQLLRLLTISMDECTHALSASGAYFNSTSAEHEDDRERAEAVGKAAIEATNKLKSLRTLKARFSPLHQHKWSVRNSRGIFAALQSELNKKIGEKDAAMDVLRLRVKRCVAALLSCLLSPSMFATGDE